MKVWQSWVSAENCYDKRIKEFELETLNKILGVEPGALKTFAREP